MPRKSAVTTPPQYILAYRNRAYVGIPDGKMYTSEDSAVKGAADYINKYHYTDPIGVYKITSIVKAKTVPVEVDTVDCKEKQ